VLSAADGQYAVGTFDGTVFRPEAERLSGHCGNATYAAQTFSDLPDGRRVLIGWMRAPSPGMPFNQGMTLPQELGLAATPEGIRLTHAPVKELASLRERSQKFGPVDVAAGAANPLAGFEAELMEVRVACDLSADAVVALDLRGVPVRYDAAKQELTIAKHQASWPVKDGKLGLIIIVDRTCVEVFSQDGLLYAPVAAIPDADVRTVSVSVEKGSAKAVRGEAHALRVGLRR
jgi:sucrose-6-phosphate hydrolase SacC (GH32 family)